MKLFIFDMGGVAAGNVHCLPAMSAALGLSPREFIAAAAAADPSEAPSPYNRGDILAVQKGTLDQDTFWLRLEGRAARFFPDRAVRVPRRGDGRPEDLWATFFKPVRDEGTLRVIEELSAAGGRVVCGTNTLSSHYDIHDARGDYRPFARVYASHLMGRVKPDPDFWRLILESEGIEPADAFFTDDGEENAAAAAALGLAVHRFVDAAGLRRALVELGALPR